jgi:hypothetical protein
MTALARRIQWLLPIAREVYTTRGLGSDELRLPCMRCASASYSASGIRHAVVFQTRARGTDWQDKCVAMIHFGCIPTSEFKDAGQAPRRRG